MYNLPFPIVLVIAVVHNPGLGVAHGVNVGSCFSGDRGLHPALNNAGIGRRYGVPGHIPEYVYASNHRGEDGGSFGWGFNHGLEPVGPGVVPGYGINKSTRLRRPLQTQTFNPNRSALPHGLPAGAGIGNGIPVVNPHHPGHGPNGIPGGFPIPPQFGETSVGFQSQAQPDNFSPHSNEVIVREPIYISPFDPSFSDGHYSQNGHISGLPNNPSFFSGQYGQNAHRQALMLSGTGVATTNDYQAGNTLLTGDGVPLSTANGELLLPPAVGRQRSLRTKTRNGLVTSDELVITRGGRVSSTSFSNRIYL